MKIDYRFNIKFNDDGVTLSFTGESIELIQKDTEEAVIRPRHIKLITELNQVMRDYMVRNDIQRTKTIPS